MTDAEIYVIKGIVADSARFIERLESEVFKGVLTDEARRRIRLMYCAWATGFAQEIAQMSANDRAAMASRSGAEQIEELERQVRAW